MERTGAHFAHLKTSTAHNTQPPGPQGHRPESRQGRRKKSKRDRTTATKGKELQKGLQHCAEVCSAHGVPRTSDRQPSESRLKKVRRPARTRGTHRAPACPPPHQWEQPNSWALPTTWVVGAAQLMGATYHLHEPAVQTHGWASTPLEGALPHQQSLTGFGRAALKDTRGTKKPPCNSTKWRDVKRTVNGPALCPCDEWRLRHSFSVVAGSSADCDCTGCGPSHRPPSGRIPSIPARIRGACKLRGHRVHELGELMSAL